MDESTKKDNDEASWLTAPDDLRFRIIDFLPSLADVGRLSFASRACHDIVETAMRRRVETTMRRGKNGKYEDVAHQRDEDGGTDPRLPTGGEGYGRSWLRFLAFRSGALLVDDRLRMGPYGTPTTGVMHEECDGFRVASSGDFATVDRFEDMNLKVSLLDAVREYGFEKPSIVQRYAVGPVAEMRDLFVHAPGGTGKTSAYGVGLLQSVETEGDGGGSFCQALVVVATRERSVNVGHFLSVLGAGLGISVANEYQCTEELGSTVRRSGEDHHVIVGSPAWMLDSLDNGAICPSGVRRLVVEADELLSRGLRDSIYRLFRAMPTTTRVCISTSNAPVEVLRLASNLIPWDLWFVRLLNTQEPTLYAVRQFHVLVSEDEKLDAICDILDTVVTMQSLKQSSTYNPGGRPNGSLSHCMPGILPIVPGCAPRWGNKNASVLPVTSNPATNDC